MNAIRRFIFQQLNIRGQHLKVDLAWQEMIADRHYPTALVKVLGELTAVTIMLANGLKHPGKVTIQIQGKGPVNLLVVEATQELKIRGVAKTNETITNQQTLDELLGDGQILVTMENTQTNHHFQSYVPREVNDIADSFEVFLSQSEQQPSKLWLAADESSIGGIMIQKMPSTDEHDIDGWSRILTLSQTLTSDEICSLNSQELLHRLFHEETIELFEEQQIAYHCPKDLNRIEKMLLSLGEEEARQILAEHGEIVVHNEMCNFHSRLTEADVNRIFGHTLQ